jgi:hypothetical protein
MYATSPESLEEQLTLLEGFRSFVLSDDQEFLGFNRYREYTSSVGKCGALSFTARRRNDIWKEYCQFFRGYLVSQGRMAGGEGTSKAKRRRSRG